MKLNWKKIFVISLVILFKGAIIAILLETFTDINVLSRLP